MKVKDLFNIKYGVNLELNKLDIISDISDSEGINFVSRTSQNNGIVARVKKINGIAPNPAGSISCAASGTVLSTFMQNEPYYSGRDLYILIPKVEMNVVEKLFYCYAIEHNKYRYSYGRQANKTLGDIELPDQIPSWVDLSLYEQYEGLVKTNINKQALALEITKWKEFKIKDLFNLHNCKCKNASLLDNGDDLFYIGAKKSDNGVIRKVSIEKALVTKGNCIVFICDGQGSVGYSNYVVEDFIGSTTLTVGYNKKLNKYNGLFLVTILDLERPKYSFGRKYRSHLKNTTVKLPSNGEGDPDWDYMENYIKGLPYSDKI